MSQSPPETQFSSPDEPRGVRPRTPCRTSGWRSGTSSRRSARGAPTTTGRTSTCSTCSRTRRATCTWVTRRRTRSATCSRGTGCSAASTCCTRSAGTPSACPRRTPRSSAASTRARGPTRTSRSRRRRCAATPARSTGTACCTPATRSTTAGTSGSSCACSSGAWPTARPATVNWCPKDQTVLANEQVVAGRCERCDTPVTKKKLTQWYFRITDYADRLLDDMAQLEGAVAGQGAARCSATGSAARPVPTSQFAIEGRDEPVTVYTTRPDTLYGATFFVVAADSDLAAELAAGTPAEAEFADVPRRRSSSRPRSTGCRPTGRRPACSCTGTRSTRSTASGCRSTPPTTCWPTTAPARSWPCPRTTSATWTSRGRSTCRCGSSSTPDDRPGGDRASRPPATARTSTPAPLDGLAQGRGDRARSSSWLEERRHRRGRGQLPAARLADLAPALLGHADPDHPLPGVRRGAGARRPAAGRAARRRRAWTCKPKGTSPLGAADRLGQRGLPDVRRPGAARHRHDGHVRRLVLVLPALRSPGSRRRAVRPGARPTRGCRSTSTSAA